MSKVRFPWLRMFMATAVTMTLVFTPIVQALSVTGTGDSSSNVTPFNVNNKVAVVAVSDPYISWSEASPEVFYPQEDERVYINWVLSGAPGYVTLDVYNGHPKDGGVFLQNLHGPNYYPEVGTPQYPISWNGKVNGQYVADGTYYYYLYTSKTAFGTVEDEAIGTFQVGTVNVTVPAVITGHDADPDPFDPDDQNTCFDVQLDKSADYVTITVKDGGQTVWGPTNTSSLSSGWSYNVKCWDGRDNNNSLVSEDVYTYEMTPYNGATGTTVYGTVEVDYDDPQVTAPTITDHDADPDPFDPEEENTCFDVELDKSADYVTVTVKDGGQTVWGPTNTSSLSSGWNYNVKCWDGRDNDNDLVDEDTYTYELKPYNGQTGSTVTGTVEVDYEEVSEDSPEVLDHDVDPDPFDPDDESACFDVRLDKDANYAMIEIKDGSTTVYGPKQTSSLNDGWNYNVHCWDGDDNDNDQVEDDTYTYYIKAHNSYGYGNTVSGTVEVDDESNGGGEEPVIGDRKGDDNDDYASRDPFNPYKYDNTTFRFYLNTDANVRFTIYDEDNDEIEEVTYDASEGTNSIEWDGRRSNGSVYSEGEYEYEIYAWNNYGNDEEHGDVEIEHDGDDDRPNITNHFADPERFDPDEEDTRIYFAIDADAEVTLEILDGSKVVRTLLDEVNRDEGSHNRYWDGEDKYGDQVDDGDYEYRIRACNDDNECDTEYGDIEVDSDGSGNDDDLITNIDVENEVFDPTDNEDSEICFTVERDDTEVTVEIMDGNRVIETLIDEVEYHENKRKCVEWDGDDDDGDMVDDDVYQYRIRAEEGNDVQVEYEYVEVDTDGRLIGFPRGGDNCAGFWDVPADSPFCEAIELMKYRGIFGGYPDGSFRPYNDINRAEVTKVVMLALDHNILSDDGSNLGFWDVQRRAWYMPYLRTAQREGVVHGYPDSSFRPNNSINRVELLKIFLEGTEIDVPYCNYAPYPDTPLTSETRWYMDYACFAKTYNLMSTDGNGNFNPDEPMSRADVAELFYRFEKRGLFAGYNHNYYNDYWNYYDEYWYYSPNNVYYDRYYY